MLDELIGSLMTYELNLRRHNEIDEGKRPIALKAQRSRSHHISDSSTSSEQDSEGEIKLLVKQFRKHLKKKDFRLSRESKFRKTLNHDESPSSKRKTNHGIVCHNCRKPGHLKTECPESSMDEEEKKKQRRKQMGMVVTGAWDDDEESTSSSSSSSQTESTKSKKSTKADKQVKCLMALN